MIRRSLVILLTVLAVLLALAVTVPATEAGSRWLLRQALVLTPGEGTFTRSRGSFWSGMRIEGLRYRLQETRLEIEQLHLDPDWSATARGRPGLEVLEAEGLHVHLPAPEPSSRNAPAGDALPTFVLPVPVRVRRLALHDLVVQQGEQRHEWTRLALAGRAKGRKLELDYLALQQGETFINWSGTLTLASPWRLDGRLAWGLPLGPDAATTFGHPAAAGEARIAGPVTQLKVRHQLHYPQPVRSEGRVRPLARPLDHDLTHHWQGLRITPPGSPPLILGAGQLDSAGAPGQYRLELQAAASDLPGLPPVRPELRARGDGRGLKIERLQLRGEAGTLRARGALEWTPELAWSLELDGENIDPGFLHDHAAGRLALTGRMDGRLPVDAPLELDLDLDRIHGRIADESIQASTRLRMRGTDGVRIRALTLDTDHGQLDTRGRVNWTPHLNWELELRGRELNPALLEPKLPGQLDLEAGFGGALPPDDKPRFDLALGRLDGRLRDRELNGSGELHLRGTESVHGNLELALGNNTLALRGRAGRDNDLAVQLDAPELAPVWPDLAGSLKADLRIRGQLPEPKLDGHVHGEQLRWRELELSELQLEAASSETGQQLVLEAGKLRHGEAPVLAAARVKARGKLAEHSLEWRLTRAEHHFSGHLDGRYKDAAWQAHLHGLALDGPLTGPWRQEEPAALTLASKTLQLDHLCLRAGETAGRLCASGDRQGPAGTSAHLSLSEVPLKPLAMFLPAGAHLEGRANGQAELTLDQGKTIGQARLDLGSGTLVLAAEREEPIRLPWRNWTAKASLSPSDWHLASRLERDNGDYADLRLTAPAAASTNRDLDGRLALEVTRLAWLELLLPRLRAPQGRLAGTLHLSGTPEQPVFDGELALNDASLQLPRAGIEVSKLQLSASAQQSSRLHLKGAARSGGGRVELTGHLDTAPAWPWPLELRLRGKNFRLVDRPDARVAVSPDLILELADGHLRLGGDVTIPRARLRPRQLPTRAVSVSDDAELVHREPGERTPWKLNIDVGVRLGDAVHFQGFGLDARFAGEVRYRDLIDQVPRMTGQLRVAKGSYQAYGQNLRIERGRLLFEGAPDNPGLDIIAVRPLPDSETRVGLEILGTLREPRARIFSEPPLEDSEAMALLLTGRPLSGTSDAESRAITQAITRFGLKKGAFLADPLTETLGVELGVEASGADNQTAVTLGKQLSDRLYLRYSVGVFESLSAVMLRYSITPKLSLETRSTGESQGADLIYRLQAD